jgi:hypothetical protein
LSISLNKWQAKGRSPVREDFTTGKTQDSSHMRDQQ